MIALEFKTKKQKSSSFKCVIPYDNLELLLAFRSFGHMKAARINLKNKEKHG